AKRLALFDKARAEFQDFLAKNAGSPRAGEARFQIAQIAVSQAKTQLTRALAVAEDDDAGRKAEFLKARARCDEAANELAAAVAAVNTDQIKARAELELGQLHVARASTYHDYEKSKASYDARAAALADALNPFEKLANRLDNKDPLQGVATAWV